VEIQASADDEAIDPALSDDILLGGTPDALTLVLPAADSSMPARGQENECYFDLYTEWISCGDYTCQLVESGTYYDCGDGCRISGTGGTSLEYEYYYNEWWEDWDVVEWMIADFELQCTVMNCSDPEIPQAWEEYCNEAPPPPAEPELVCTDVYRGEWVECTLDVAGVIEVDHVAWSWHPDSNQGFFEDVVDTLESTTWEGIGAWSGLVTATAFSAGGDSVGPISAPLTVLDRPWAAPTTFVQYEAGAAADCHTDIPRPGSGAITWGWAVAVGSCAATELVTGLSDTTGPPISHGSGPNAGLYFVDTVTAVIRMESQILPALRPGSSDRFPVNGPQQMRNDCKSALGSPTGVTDTVTIEYANTECIANQEFEDAITYLWDHEHEHATAAEEGVDGLADPYAAIERIVGGTIAGVRVAARGILHTVNDAARVSSQAIDGATGPGFDIWLPGTTGIWDDPTSEVLALGNPLGDWISGRDQVRTKWLITSRSIATVRSHQTNVRRLSPLDQLLSRGGK
jgi:hypothetical protein